MTRRVRTTGSASTFVRSMDVHILALLLVRLSVRACLFSVPRSPLAHDRRPSSQLIARRSPAAFLILASLVRCGRRGGRCCWRANALQAMARAAAATSWQPSVRFLVPSRPSFPLLHRSCVLILRCVVVFACRNGARLVGPRVQQQRRQARCVWAFPVTCKSQALTPALGCCG